MISGEIVDWAALHGALNKIRNLNLALISVTGVGSGPADPIRQTDQLQPIVTFSSTQLEMEPMSLLKRYPLVTFFALAYLISWSVVPFGLFFTLGR